MKTKDLLQTRLNVAKKEYKEKNSHRYPDFPCKQVGDVEHSYFAKRIDDYIETECVVCAPGDHPPEYYCSWKFHIPE